MEQQISDNEIQIEGLADQIQWISVQEIMLHHKNISNSKTESKSYSISESKQTKNQSKLKQKIELQQIFKKESQSDLQSEDQLSIQLLDLNIEQQQLQDINIEIQQDTIYLKQQKGQLQQVLISVSQQVSNSEFQYNSKTEQTQSKLSKNELLLNSNQQMQINSKSELSKNSKSEMTIHSKSELQINSISESQLESFKDIYKVEEQEIQRNKSISFSRRGAKRTRQSISNDEYNSNSAFINFLKYFMHEIGIDLIIQIISMIILYFMVLKINYTCFQYDLTQKFQLQCKNEQEQLIAQLKEFFLFDILFLNFIFQTIKIAVGNRNSFKIYTIICLLAQIVLRFFAYKSQIIIYGVLWFFTLIYLIYLIKVQKMFILNVLERILFPLIYFIFFNLQTSIVLANPFELSPLILMIFQSVYLSINQQIIIRSFLVKLRLGNPFYTDIRIQILIMYMIDNGTFMSSITTSEIGEEPLFNIILFGFNFVVIIVYNLTQFHFMYYICKQFAQKLWDLTFQGRCYELKRIILMVINIISENIDIFIDQIKKKFYKEENTILFIAPYTENDINRVMSSYYIIGNSISCFYFVFLYLVQVHIPYRSVPASHKLINENQLTLDNQINSKVFNLTLTKIIITYGTFILTTIAVLAYSYKYNIKFFGLLEIQQNNILERTLVILYLLYIINDYSFR